IAIKALSLSKHIEDAPWFSRSWSKDPTVTAMLVMLDAIDSKLKNKDYEKIWLTITNTTSSLISFQFLPMSQFGLADELYIKMNARGKALTDFENFKAWLERYAENFEDLPNDWLTKLDTTWADVFWKIKDEFKNKSNQGIDNIENFDNSYLNFFKSMGLFSYVANLETSGQKDALKSKENTLVSSLHEEKYVAISSYEAMKCFNTKSLSQMFTVLDACAAYPKQTKQILSDLVDKPNYWQRARFYALAQFLTRAPSPIVFDIQFERWQRVCNNLINNTFINNTLQFARVIKNIRKLSNAVFDDYNGDILAYFKDTPKPLNQLSKKQQDEEIIKATLIKENPDWEQSIIKVENHPYFDGQIGFLLDFAKNESIYDLEQFRQYAAKATYMFNDELLISQKDNKKEVGFLVQRALLCQGDKSYLVKLSSERKNFCLAKSSSLREREDNWRGVFNSNSSSKALKTLLDKIPLDNSAIKEVLTKIIDEEATKFTCADWRYYFLKSPSLIAKCYNGKIRIKKNDNGEIINIFLLSKEQMNGYHAELRSYFFQKEYLSSQDNYLPFTEIKYFSAANSQYTAYAGLNGWKFDGEQIQLRIECIHHGNNVFRLRLASDKNLNIHPYLKVILDNHHFDLRNLDKQNWMCLDVTGEESVLETIQTLLPEFNKLALSNPSA
ncbi:MAG TPA: hypothetical protein PKC44_12690, partial [Agitococcus sp.]|nr:hypothetical protein [Agitococcus sp.]